METQDKTSSLEEKVKPAEEIETQTKPIPTGVMKEVRHYEEHLGLVIELIPQ